MMSIKKQIQIYQSIDNWFYSPQGLWAGKLLIEALTPFIDILRGHTMLQIGQCGTNPWLQSLQFAHKWIASPYSSNQPNHLISSLSQLPLERDSIDCILAPLTMESFVNNATILDEMDRILKPMGYLIVFGLNPFSMWGLGSKLGLVTGFTPNMLHLHFSFHLNRACIARGFQQLQLANFGYIPPVRSQTCIKNLFFMDEIGKMIWPFPANFYCYIAQKYEPGYPLQPYFAEVQLEGCRT
jgi:hypothetical protein